MIVTVAHQKGGVGKTTLATNLAQVLGADLLDLDLQQSCVLWNRLRKSAGLPEMLCQVPASLEEADEIIKAHKGPEKYLIVDCGGFDSVMNRAAILRADLLLTPVAPSQVELFGLRNFTSILDAAGHERGGNIITNVVVNNADSRSQGMIEELQSYIRATPAHLRLIDTVIHWRADFKRAYAAGASVAEYAPKGKAAEEIAALANEIKSMFNSN